MLSDGSGNQATATVTNSILGQNGATTVSDFYAGIFGSGTAPNLGSSTNNLVSDNPLSPNGLTGTITGTNPNFATGMLAFNGGQTNTIALTSASTAALGQATTTTGITVDQRGVRRNAATPDVGAFEFTRPAPTTYTVTVATDNSGSSAGSGSGTSGDLRYCIDQAILDVGAADTINFASALAGSTITLASGLSTSPLLMNPYGATGFVVSGGANITINGAAVPGLTINGGDAQRLFAVAGGSTLNLENLTLSGGLAQGGEGGSSDAGGSGGGGAGLGGAVLIDGSMFTANGCTFTNNGAEGGAGGNNDVSTESRGGGGGGGMGPPVAQNGNDQSTFGITAGNGGGLNGGQGGLDLSTFTGTPGGLGGGGAGGSGGGSSSGANGTGIQGGAGGFGGGGGGGGYRLEGGGGGGFGGGGGGDNASAGGVGPGGFGGGSGGGGGSVGGGGGGGAGLGGAIFSTSGTLTLTNDTFASNHATGGGAGSGPQSGGAGQGDGGAIFVRNGNLTATFDTFSSNKVANGDTAAGVASDLYVLSDGSGNQATATVTNSILGQNGTTTVSDFYANTYNSGTTPNLASSTNNLVSDNPLSPNGLTGTITGTNPNFATGMLAFNGGPTPTIALTSASTAALGRATTTTGIMVDQRGVHRNAATPDVGAFEFTPPPATTYTVTVATDNSGSSAGTGSGTRGDLRYCINQATLDDGSADTINFASGLAGSTITLASGLTTSPLLMNPYGATGFVLSGAANITINGAVRRADDQRRQFRAAVCRGRRQLPQPQEHDPVRRLGGGGPGRWCQRRGRGWRRGRTRGRRLDRRQHVHRQWLHLHGEPSHRWCWRNRHGSVIPDFQHPRGRRRGWNGRTGGWQRRPLERRQRRRPEWRPGLRSIHF